MWVYRTALMESMHLFATLQVIHSYTNTFLYTLARQVLIHLSKFCSLQVIYREYFAFDKDWDNEPQTMFRKEIRVCSLARLPKTQTEMGLGRREGIHITDDFRVASKCFP